MKELGLGKEDECRVFYVYDADVDCIVERLLTLPGMTILSNPSIELWYLLHCRDNRRFIAPDSIIKELSSSHSAWNSYAKGRLRPEQQDLLLSNQKSATLRAVKMDWPVNPSSNMHLFIEALEDELR